MGSADELFLLDGTVYVAVDGETVRDRYAIGRVVTSAPSGSSGWRAGVEAAVRERRVHSHRGTETLSART